MSSPKITDEPFLGPHERAWIFHLRRRVHRLSQGTRPAHVGLVLNLKALIGSLERGEAHEESEVESWLAQADRALRLERADRPRPLDEREVAKHNQVIAAALREFASNRPEAVRDAIGVAANLLEAGQL